MREFKVSPGAVIIVVMAALIMLGWVIRGP